MHRTVTGVILSLLLVSPLAFSQSNGISLELIAETKDKSLLSQVVSADLITKPEDRLRIYIADVFTPAVLILEKQENDLVVINQLGRDGKGPGEFVEINALQIMPDNNLMTYDRNLGRVTVFNLEMEKMEYTFSLRSASFPMNFYAAGVQQPIFYARAEPYFSDSDATDMKRTIQMQKYDAEGNLLNDSVLVKPSNDAFIFQDRGSMAVNPEPVWGNKSIFRFYREYIYYAWGDNSSVEVYSANGEKLPSISLNLPRLPITNDDRKRALDFEAFMMDKRKRTIKDEFLKKMPDDYWPWLQDFFVDDKERFWIGMPHHLKENTRNWRIHDMKGNFIDEVTLPANFTVHQIKKNYIVGELFNFKRFRSSVQLYKIHE
ncbi:MAG: 6-bladed beta-propeller [Balneolaceae bacterium]